MSIETKELYTVLVEQEHHTIIPFTITVDKGVESASTMPFEITTSSNQYFDYSVLLGGPSLTNSNNQVYVPENEATKIDHNNAFHVEVIAKDVSGIREYNVRTQEELYGYKTPLATFNIPKFIWSNEVFGGVLETEVDENLGYVWIGDSSGKINRIQYDSNAASNVYSEDFGSEIKHIVFEEDNNKTYITTSNNIIACNIDNYWQDNVDTTMVYTELSVDNTYNDIVSFIDGEYVWSIESYLGKAIYRESSTLDIVTEYDGLDAPHKVIWSDYHQSYFVAGTNILWKIANDSKQAVYSVRGYDIADLSCSPDGYICILFDGDNDDIIRILRPNLYTIAISENMEVGTAKFCTYCDQGIFYILVELSDVSSYGITSYVYDSKKGILERFSGNAIMLTTTTTTTPSAPVNKVAVDYPNGDERLYYGDEVEIKWRSTESITDLVRIELYRGDVLQETIVNQASNTGVYKWVIPETIASGVDYKVKITWIGTTELEFNSDISDKGFIITSVETTTTTTTMFVNNSIGIGYDKGNRHIVNVLNNGLVGFFDLNERLFYGLFDSGVSEPTCAAVRDEIVRVYSKVTAVRVFVGSERYLSDMWDSGIVQTDKNAMYYGGGNNLVPGVTYYVNIQVYDARYGWSAVQTKEWVMPR